MAGLAVGVASCVDSPPSAGHTSRSRVNLPEALAALLVGRAAARRLGDLARALLDAARSHYRHVDLPAGPPRVLAGLAWWALAPGHPDAAVFAADAAEDASASRDPPRAVFAAFLRAPAA